MIVVMACVQPGDKLSNGGVLFMDWVLQGVSWGDAHSLEDILLSHYFLHIFQSS